MRIWLAKSKSLYDSMNLAHVCNLLEFTDVFFSFCHEHCVITLLSLGKVNILRDKMQCTVLSFKVSTMHNNIEPCILYVIKNSLKIKFSDKVKNCSVTFADFAKYDIKPGFHSQIWEDGITLHTWKCSIFSFWENRRYKSILVKIMS